MASNLDLDKYLSIRNIAIPMFFLSLYVGITIECLPVVKVSPTAMAIVEHTPRRIQRPVMTYNSVSADLRDSVREHHATSTNSKSTRHM